MASRTTRTVARLLWALPLLLLVLTIQQFLAAAELRQTHEQGMLHQAAVTDVFKSERADITLGRVTLHVTLDDGTQLTQETPLPLSLMPQVESRDSVAVRVLPDADKAIVVDVIGRAQWRMAAINGAMSLVGMLMLAVGVFFWNRFLTREGDPADRVPTPAA